MKELLNQKLAGTGFQVNSIEAFEVSIALADGISALVAMVSKASSSLLNPCSGN